MTKKSKSWMPLNCWCIKYKQLFKIKPIVLDWCLWLPSSIWKWVLLNYIFQVMLLIMMHFGCMAEVFDLITVFLSEELEEETYVECPPCMKNVSENMCTILQHYINLKPYASSKLVQQGGC